MEPFDRHPADPGVLEETAAALARLADQAIDQREATLAAFDPARGGWDGVAASELQHAPDGVQQDAYEVSSAVFWGSVPLRYWADRVTQFNAKVAEIEERYHARMAALQVPAAAAGSPSVALQIESARANAPREFGREWRQVHQEYIVDGASRAAQMYREGPTEGNLRAARAVGAIPLGAGAAAVFPTLWHDGNMRRTAHDAVEMARRILADGEPSEEDLARLNDVLAEYGADEAFAYYMLRELGPDGLLRLTADVAVIQYDDLVRTADPPDPGLAALVGSIQAGLGVALATATNNSIRRDYVLGERWWRDLTDAGDEMIVLDGVGAAPYGYQMLGVLLRSPDANFGPAFLNHAGGAMLDFELRMRHSGVGDVWTFGNQLDAVRLNWIDGHDENAPLGRDPISGLMVALDRDPAAAREFFSTSATVEGESRSRVDYLLTDRPEYLWSLEPSTDGLPEGVRHLTHALTGATRNTSNEDAGQIVHDIVVSVGRDGLVYTGVREPLGGIAAHWIENIHDAAAGLDRATDLTARQVVPFLQEIGKDDEAWSTVAQAATRHLIAEYDYMFDHIDEAVGPDGQVLASPGDMMDSTARPTAIILRSMDEGFENDNWSRVASDEHRLGMLMEGVQAVLNRTPAAPAVEIANLAGVDDAIAGHFNEAVESDAGDRILERRNATVDGLMTAYWTAVAANGGPAGPDLGLPTSLVYDSKAGDVEALYADTPVADLLNNASPNG
jgi:hypothetical protein